MDKTISVSIAHVVNGTPRRSEQTLCRTGFCAGRGFVPDGVCKPRPAVNLRFIWNLEFEMCGITGIFSFNGLPPFREKWAEFVNHLAHRGPDEGAWWADGPFFFGHRRLSVLDISGGGQPMATADGALVVTFNGEIYNYVELREELKNLGYIFRSNSDTEVLLHGYHAWKEQLPERLTGMFAFAIADRRKKEMFLARDRFGEKPLLIMHTSKYVAFSSELRSLAAFPDLSRTVDIEALGGYLSLNYVPGSATLMKGIERIPPSSWKLFSLNEEKQGVYWSPPDKPDTDQTLSSDEAGEVLQHHLDCSVRIAMRSDVPVGIFLSGGIDSSLIAESATRQGNISTAYVVDFEEESYSEYDAARFVADKLGIPLERIILTQKDLKDFFQLVLHADDPLADSSALAVWTLSRFAARQSKVVLGGDGGDELFGGYQTYLATLLHQKVMSRLPVYLRKLIAAAGPHIPTNERKVSFSYKLRRFLRAADLSSGQAHFTWNGTWLPKEAASLVQPEHCRDIVLSQLPDRVRYFGLEEKPGLLQLQLADIAEYLQNDILIKADRMSMAHGLEIRSPYLQHPLAEWALSRPDWQKIGPRGRLKSLLRHLADKKFGKTIADRPKQGFSLPIHAWVRGALSQVALDLLSSESLKSIEFLNSVKIREIVDAHFLKQRSYGFELWGLMVLVAWYRMRIMSPPESPHDLPLIERNFGRYQPGLNNFTTCQ